MFVSVVTAVYNGQDFLLDCIQSILSQTHKDFEYIIVNDGSTDKTKDILETIRDNRVSVIHSQQNNGAASSLNLAIQHTKGEWIAIQDADDVSLPNRLEEQVGYIKRNPDIGAVGSLIECISGKGKHQKDKLANEAKHFNKKLTKEQILNYRFHGNPLCHGSVLFSKQLFVAVGCYDKTYRIAYDYDLWMRMLEKKYIKKVPKVLYQWRLNSDSLCHLDLKASCLEVMVISTKYIQAHLVSEVNRVPKLLVIGSANACDAYAKEITSFNDICIESTIVSKKTINSLSKRKLKPIDGIIVLENHLSAQIINSLEMDRWIKNFNLFVLWNVFD